MTDDIHPEYGVPREQVSCPGCGKVYRRNGKVCLDCEECKTCHGDGRCRTPNLVPTSVLIAKILS